jgi:glycosyltransferase involved in cell wall biosynthesis
MKKKYIKILHLIDTTGAAGAEKILTSILFNIDRTKFKSLVILSDKGWLYKKLQEEANINIYVHDSRGRINYRFVYYLCKFILLNKIDIIHSHLLGSALYGSISGFICRIPVICSIHGFIDVDPKDRLIKIKNFIISCATKKIVFVSDQLKNFYIRKYSMSKKKSITIYNGIPLNFKPKTKEKKINLRRKLGYSENDILVGVVGNVKKVKGYKVLLKVGEIMGKKYSNLYFLVAGNTNSQEYNNLMMRRKKCSLEKTVQFLGYLDNIDEFMQMIDIFLLTSFKEGFSLATIEAMNAGVPVVVTKSGGPEEIVLDQQSGIVANVGDEKSLAAGIIRIIENRNFRDRLIKNAKKALIDKFSLELMIKNYETLYESELNKTLKIGN